MTNSSPSFQILSYGGQFAGAALSVPDRSNVVATPADPQITAELARRQEAAVRTHAPRLHDVLYSPGGLDAELATGHDQSMAVLLGYARAAGKTEANNETMVTPQYVRVDGTLGYNDRSPLRKYSDVETFRRGLTGWTSPAEAANLVTALAAVTGPNGERLPIPVLGSITSGANVITVFRNSGLDDSNFPGVDPNTPVVALTRRGEGASYSGQFGTFGGAVSYDRDRGPDGEVVIVGHGGKGGASATAAELMEESGRLTPISYENVNVLVQHDLQLSTGAVEVVDMPLAEAVRLMEGARDRGEFARVGRSRVLPVPLDLEYLTAAMCTPVNGGFVARMPSWSALLAVDAFQVHAGLQQANVLRSRIGTPESMERAYSAVPEQVREATLAAMDQANLEIAH